MLLCAGLDVPFEVAVTLIIIIAVGAHFEANMSLVIRVNHLPAFLTFDLIVGALVSGFILL